ncbi:unnamed protein product [Paramecium sonneborni]|uniref:Uncharacterized protein n=1 Tax=Paramecium sonneborni TaxID=65129 RepID=A0A8S1KHM6_9CILI|nr:unnamed protein product [Paramecium sonneborni]
MRQQLYFIKPVNHLSYRNQSIKQSFSQQQSEESKSKSQNRLSNIKKKPAPIITQAINSPKLKRINNQLRILKSNKVDLPSIPSPQLQQQSDQSFSKIKSFENLNIQMRQSTPRRFKSDEPNISELGNQPKKTIRFSQHSNIRLRNDSAKARNNSNYIPIQKTQTEPSEIIHSPIVHLPKRDFDDSREILYQLQRGYSKEKQSILKTEPDDPYRIRSDCENRNSTSLKRQFGHQCINESQRFPTKHHIDMPCDDEFSMFFKEDDNGNNFKNTQKNTNHSNQISQQTKEKILDLLFLSTGELKKKFNEQSKIQYSKITNKIQQNKPIVPKNRFPNDFFNVLNSNESQLF